MHSTFSQSFSSVLRTFSYFMLSQTPFIAAFLKQLEVGSYPIGWMARGEAVTIDVSMHELEAVFGDAASVYTNVQRVSHM